MIFALLALTVVPLWLIFTYQDDSPLALLWPIPQSPSPKLKWSVIDSGRSLPIDLEPLASRPSAVFPISEADLPLPPVPEPKQVACLLVLTEMSGDLISPSASCTLPAPTTRRVAVTLLAEALAANAAVKQRASRQTPAVRSCIGLGI